MFYKLTRALFCSFVAVNCLSSIENYALDKIKDPEYMKTQYQYSNELGTKRMALRHIYEGGNSHAENISREAAQEGFLIWKKDADYLSSEDFRTKILSSDTFDECVSDFDLWEGVTSVSGLFHFSWYKAQGEAAISCLEEMCRTYERWRREGGTATDFVGSRLSKLTYLLDDTKEGAPYRIEFRD